MKNDFFSYAASETGHNHKKVGKICEDSSGVYDDEKMHICVVADGHGSDDYPRTDRGSSMAVRSVLKCVKDFIHMVDPYDVLKEKENSYPRLTQLTKSILNHWYTQLEEDYELNPFTNDELANVSDKYKEIYLSDTVTKRKIEKAYGCTLIVCAVTDKYSFGLQIGDGKCVLFNRKGEVTEPIPDDEECQFNITTSICDDDAIDEFRYFVCEEPPLAVFCGTDGVENSYSGSQLYSMYRSVLSIFLDYGTETGKNEINEYLPVISQKGSGDDVSVAFVINMALANDLKEIIKTDVELNNLEEEDLRLTQKIKILYDKREKIDRSVKDYVCNKINDILSDSVSVIKKINAELSETLSRLFEVRKSSGDLRTKKQNALKKLNLLFAEIKAKNESKKASDEEEKNSHYNENVISEDFNKSKESEISYEANKISHYSEEEKPEDVSKETEFSNEADIIGHDNKIEEEKSKDAIEMKRSETSEEENKTDLCNKTDSSDVFSDEKTDGQHPETETADNAGDRSDLPVVENPENDEWGIPD